ncbi:hypothetical protein GEMRC1_013065 [Eukaryota sp. GEM-RC1]
MNPRPFFEVLFYNSAAAEHFIKAKLKLRKGHPIEASFNPPANVSEIESRSLNPSGQNPAVPRVPRGRSDNNNVDGGIGRVPIRQPVVREFEEVLSAEQKVLKKVGFDLNEVSSIYSKYNNFDRSLDYIVANRS